MRAKTLLLTAVLTAAGIASAAAQVYSVNMVGYVNLTLKAGFQMICNPLDNKNPNGNTISNLFAAVPDGTIIFRYNGATFTGNIKEFGEWNNNTDLLLPGQGVFVKLPAISPDVTVLFVGDVPTGNLSTTIPAGLSIVSSQVPQAGTLETDLKYTPTDGDVVFKFDYATQNYKSSIYDLGEWPNNVQPTLAVGESFFLKAAAAKTWTRTFTVGP